MLRFHVGNPAHYLRKLTKQKRSFTASRPAALCTTGILQKCRPQIVISKMQNFQQTQNSLLAYICETTLSSARICRTNRNCAYTVRRRRHSTWTRRSRPGGRGKRARTAIYCILCTSTSTASEGREQVGGLRILYFYLFFTMFR